VLRIPVDQLVEGMVLARSIPVPDNPRQSLLQRNVSIPLDVVPRLLELGIREVWVRSPEFEFLEGLIDDGVEEQRSEVYAQVRKSFAALTKNPLARLNVREMQESVRGLVEYLKASPCKVLIDKFGALDNYLMAHSANVCYLALMLGLRLERRLIAERPDMPVARAKDLRGLGLGCLLHDVGKTKLPAEIVDKPGPLTSEEMDLMRKHPTFGYNMIFDQAPPSAAQVVLNHHQRWDGAGYPRLFDRCSGEMLAPMAGRGIPIFSRIATLCDVYDAATTHRCYSGAKPAVQALFEMQKFFRGAFDPEIERAFYEITPPFPPGKLVGLSIGIDAVVTSFDPNDPTRPKVQCLSGPPSAPGPILGEELDLAVETEVDIVSIQGVDVRPFLPTLRSLASNAV
jgi:HD-GYP domain-containing protein (c-di-GMP phosphodiesterase class II)